MESIEKSFKDYVIIGCNESQLFMWMNMSGLERIHIIPNNYLFSEA